MASSTENIDNVLGWTGPVVIEYACPLEEDSPTDEQKEALIDPCSGDFLLHVHTIEQGQT